MEVKLLLNISDFPWAECAITENRSLYISDSLSLKRHKRNTGNHRYEFELVTIDMETKQGRGILAQLSAASDDVIYFVHPVLSFTQGYEPPTGVESSGVNLAGSKVVNLTGSGQAWESVAGDYISFGNDTKVYQVAIGTDASAGIKQITLTSPLRNELPDGTTVAMNNVGFYLASNGIIEVGMLANDSQDMQITLVAVEQL